MDHEPVAAGPFLLSSPPSHDVDFGGIEALPKRTSHFLDSMRPSPGAVSETVSVVQKRRGIAIATHTGGFHGAGSESLKQGPFSYGPKNA